MIFLNAFKPAESVADSQRPEAATDCTKQRAVGEAKGHLDESWEYEGGNRFKGYVER
jgi:hypothetical protein